MSKKEDQQIVIAIGHDSVMIEMRRIYRGDVIPYNLCFTYETREQGMGTKFIAWGKIFESGVPEIDAEHKILFEIANQFYDNIRRGDDEAVVFATLNKLVRYAESHFRREEALLVEIGYPEDKVLHHKDTHQRLIDQIFEVYETQYEISNNRLIDQPEKVKNFLTEWLIMHILTEDRDYFEHIHRQEAVGFAAFEVKE